MSFTSLTSHVILLMLVSWMGAELLASGNRMIRRVFGKLSVLLGMYALTCLLIMRAAVYGQAIGDALGVPYEFHDRNTFTCTCMIGHGTHNQQAGTWSDDTSMMLATLDSLIGNDWQVDIEDMQHRFNAWLYDGEYAIDGNVFDCGNTVREALHRGHGLHGEWDNGNGSLMRIMPLAFTEADRETVGEVSAITHAHRLSQECCWAWV